MSVTQIGSLDTGNEAANRVSLVSTATANVGPGDPKKDQNKKEIERLRSTSDQYRHYAPLWDFFLAAYEGGAAMANGSNLFKHVRETQDDFNARSKRVYYHNFCYPLVDFFTTFIFTETIQRDGEDNRDFYDVFQRDVNKKGDDITSFMMHVCDDMQIFGMTYVLVDAPKKGPGQENLTLAQEAELGIRPYWVTVRPTEVLDWETDQFDKFIYLKRVEHLTTVNPSDMSKQLIERYSEWTPQTIKVSEIDVTEPDKPRLSVKGEIIPNAMEKVPFVVVRYKRVKSDKFMGMSFLNDLAFINREVMNLTSLLQEFLYRQCFNILAMEETSNVAETEQLQGEIGIANMLRYPEGAKAPQYITPPVAPAQFLQAERAENIVAMYKIAAQDTQNDLFNGGKSSGFSKAQSFATTVPKIATRAETLQAAEMQLMQLTMEYIGKDWNGSIKYKDHYQITNLTDALSQLSTLFKDLQINSKTFAEMQMKRMIDEFDGKLTPEQRKLVYEEIEAIDWPEWFDTMKLAFLGRAALAPETALMMDEPDVKASAASALGAPVKGKDTPTAGSTPARAQSGSKEIAQESSGGKK